MRRSPVTFEGLATAAAAASRVSNLSAGLVVWGSRPSHRITRACYSGWAGLALAGLFDIVRTRRFRRGWIVVDAALCTVTNLSPSSWPGDRSLPVLAYGQMASLVVSAAATADFSPVASASVFVAWASWSWGLAGQRRRHPDTRVPIIAASVEPLLTYGAVALLSRHLRSLEAEMDTLRESARRDAEAATLEAERERQHRLLHDTALQTLEAVAGDWHTDESSLRTLAATDAAQLRHALDNTQTTPTTDLEANLTDLVDTYRNAGLDVTLQSHNLTNCNAPGTQAITDATREALVNALKHAGPAHTTVIATADKDTVTVTITDDGTGFDPTPDTTGFGIEHSIKARINDTGGNAHIESAPGQGTAVHLSVPRHR